MDMDTDLATLREELTRFLVERRGKYPQRDSLDALARVEAELSRLREQVKFCPYCGGAFVPEREGYEGACPGCERAESAIALAARLHKERDHWEEWYKQEHRTRHSMEDEIARLREQRDRMKAAAKLRGQYRDEWRERAEDAEKELAEGPLSYPITGGYVLIDRGDLALIEAYKWSIQNDGRGKEFALATCRATGKKRSVRMHRLILDATEGQLVDHVNGNTLDNRRSNLRLATAADNQRNKDHAESESGYKGVHKKKRGGWDASLSVGGVPHRLGSYASPAEAALVRDLAALELHGEFASTNYPTEVLQRIVTAEARCARLQQALAKADKAASKAHDAMWAMDFDKTSASSSERDAWKRLREQASDAIWAIHNLLRPLMAREALAGLGSGQDPVTGSEDAQDTPDSQECEHDWVQEHGTSGRYCVLCGAGPNTPADSHYRERPIEEDFYLDPRGEWVYRWSDERRVLKPADSQEDKT